MTSRADIVRRLVEDARVCDLGQPMEPGIPVSPNHPGFHMPLLRPHGNMVLPGGISGATEMFLTGGHVGTQMDALTHISHQGNL